VKGNRARVLEGGLESAQSLAENLARSTGRQLWRLLESLEKSRQRLLVPVPQRRLQRAFRLGKERFVAALQHGVAAFEPGDLELQIADVSERVLELLHRRVELVQPQEPQRRAQPSRCHAHFVHRVGRGYTRFRALQLAQPRRENPGRIEHRALTLTRARSRAAGNLVTTRSA